MPELYDNVRRANSQYVPQFIGSNAETIKSVSDILQTRSLQNQNAVDDSLVRVLNEKYAPGDEYIGQGIYEDMNKLRGELASSDQGFENSTGVVRNAVRDKVLTNRDRIEGLRNSAEWDKYQDLKSKFGEQGEDFTPTWKGTKNADGTYNRFRADVEQRLDKDKKKETFFNQMEADMHEGQYKPGKDALQDYIVSVTSGGISDPKIRQYADKAFTRYRGSSEEIQERKAYKRDNPGITDAEIDRRMADSIVATGLERVYGVSKRDISRTATLRDSNTEQGAPIIASTGTGAAITNNILKPTLTTDGSNGPSLMVKPGENVPDQSKFKYRYTDKGGNSYYEDIAATEAQLKAQDAELRTQYAKDQGQQGEAFPFTSFEEYKESKIEADKNSALITGSQTQLEGNQKDVIANKINGTKTTAPIYDSNGAKLNFTDVVSKSGVPANQITFEPVYSYDESPNSNIPGGFVQVNVKYADKADPKSDAPTILFMPVSNEQVKAMAPIDKLYKASLYPGKDTYTEEKPFDPEQEFPELAGKFRTPTGEKYTYTTQTIHKPKGTYAPGESPYETMVYAQTEKIVDGKKVRADETDDTGRKIAVPINEWKEIIKAHMHKIYQNSINTGTTSMNVDDVKKRGLNLE